MKWGKFNKQLFIVVTHFLNTKRVQEKRRKKNVWKLLNVRCEMNAVRPKDLLFSILFLAHFLPHFNTYSISMVQKLRYQKIQTFHLWLLKWNQSTFHRCLHVHVLAFWGNRRCLTIVLALPHLDIGTIYRKTTNIKNERTMIIIQKVQEVFNRKTNAKIL